MSNTKKVSYEKRYESMSDSKEVWNDDTLSKCIVKKIGRVSYDYEDKRPELDCGLLCEEFGNCDFFIHGHRKTCFLGSLQEEKENQSSTLGHWEVESYYSIYPVNKSS